MWRSRERSDDERESEDGNNGTRKVQEKKDRKSVRSDIVNVCIRFPQMSHGRIFQNIQSDIL